MIEHHDIAELIIAAEMIQMRVRVDHGDGMLGQRLDDSPQISNAAASIDEHGMPVDEQVQYGMLIMARFRDGIEIIADFQDLEPVILNCDAMWLREGFEESSRLAQFR